MVTLKSTTKRKPAKKTVKVKVNFEIDMPLECLTSYDYNNETDMYDETQILATNAAEAIKNLESLASEEDNILYYLLYCSEMGTIQSDKWEIEILD